MSVRPKVVEMTSELLAVPGAAAAPPEPPRRPASASVPQLPEPAEETLKRTVSVRLSVETIDRLREYTHRRRQQKQDVIEVAIARFLAEEGF